MLEFRHHPLQMKIIFSPVLSSALVRGFVLSDIIYAMEYKILKEDPFNILATTKKVVENPQYVFINEEKIYNVLAGKILERFNKGINSEYEEGFRFSEKIEDNLQLSFIENVVNFCFWPEKGEQKWEVEYPAGRKSYGGWYGLVSCFDRGIAEGIPILDSSYLSNFTFEEASRFFRGKSNTEIPLLNERVANLREAGEVLFKKFGGKIVKLLEANDYDSVKITKSIYENFSSFKDISNLDGGEVFFLKRAQICANDFSYVLKNTENKITNLDKMTAYADYKLPQLLRMFGVISYSKSLSDKVDNMIGITHDSREEIEIRSATIWAVELLRQHISVLTTGEIDNTIWLMSQDIQNESKPYHRSRTIFY
jgi:hypothetical protein